MTGKIEGLYREEELEIPYKALRVCCTNALCHRLYHRTMEKLLSGHNSEPQNLIIANVLYKSEVLENWGRGIGLMISECRREGLPEPIYKTDADSVRLIFRYESINHPSTTQVPPK